MCAGCFKDVSYKTSYVIKPLSQETSRDETLPLEGARAYAYDVDTTFWEVATYEDALAGVVSRKENPSERLSSPYATAESYQWEGAVGWLRMPLDKPSQMVVVVDPTHRLYAFTQQEIVENLPVLYVSLAFKPWKEGYSFREGAWVVCNEFYEPPVYLDCYIVPSLQLAEDGPVTQSADLTAYAFTADTTSWRIASYADAVAGVITSKSNPQETRKTPDFKAFYETTTGRYGMEVSSPTLMVVVVDPVQKMYAYSQQDVELKGDPVEFPLLFRPWKQQYISVEEGGWRVVDPAFAPETEPASKSRR